MWDVHMNINNWVLMPCPIAHELILPQHVCQEGLSPTVSRLCGKDPPYRPHSLGDGSKCRRRKGLKTVCLGPTRTSDMEEIKATDCIIKFFIISTCKHCWCSLVRVGPKQTVFNPFSRRHLEPSPSECGR